MTRLLATVILAAGKGTRMNNPAIAKVMHEMNGKPMLGIVVDLATSLHSTKTIVVVGWQKDAVVEFLRESGKRVSWVEQSPQLGTGHAVMQARDQLRDFEGDVLVLSGDVPLLTSGTVERLLNHHRLKSAAATVLTAIAADPTGYGRIVRTANGHVCGIVEQKDATESQREITEINSGIYVFDSRHLLAGLAQITPSNAQKEYYLTDVFEYLWKNNLPVEAISAPSLTEVMGINTVAQLEEARNIASSARVDNTQ